MPTNTIYSLHHSEHPLTTYLHHRWQEQKVQNQHHSKKPQVEANTQSEHNTNKWPFVSSVKQLRDVWSKIPSVRTWAGWGWHGVSIVLVFRSVMAVWPISCKKNLPAHTAHTCYAWTRCSPQLEVSWSGINSGLSALATCDADMW